MRITIDHGGVRDDRSLIGLPDTATVGEVLAYASSPGSSTVIDGRDIATDLRFADVARDGSVVAVDAARPPTTGEVVAILHAVAGPDAGRVWRLQAGTFSVGSGRSIDLSDVAGLLTVSPDGDVRWDGAHLPSGLLRAGPHLLRAAPVPFDPTEHPPGARSFFNRPPRHIESAAPDPIHVPTRPSVSGKPRRLSPLMLVLPAVTGVGMAVIFGRMMFLAFAILGPITMLGSTFDDRRRRRRDQREADEQFEQDLARLAADLAAAGRAHKQRLIASNPSVSELLVLGQSRSQRLWERRRGHIDYLTVAIGYGSVTWMAPTDGDLAADADVAATAAAASRLVEAPITTTLTERRMLGVAGDRTEGRGHVSDIVCQLASTHGPADLRFAVITDDPLAWDWLKWLPHTVSNQLSDVRLLAHKESEINSLLCALRAGEPAESDPLVVLVVDHQSLDEDQRRMIRECMSGLGRRASAVTLVETPEQLPTQCTEVVELGDRSRFRRPHAGLTVEPVTFRSTPPVVAEAVARALAPLDDPESAVAGAGLPDRVSLLELLGIDDPTAGTIRARWKSAGRRPTIATPVGMSEAGVFTVDLVEDGPHGLMAGTTGAGKSEFLRSLVAGLAATVSPGHLTFVLVDYKGGAAFDACADLPHVVGLVTDLDQHVAARALQSLEAELHHREERLRDVGASDIDEFWSRSHKEPLPRLALVVDEFATLAKELPEFMDALVDIAQRGRSLGVHMLLATQRPSGVIKDSIRANTNLRISLRVQTVADSKDVLNSAEAAAVPRARPGRGYARLGPGELIPFQTALSTATNDDRHSNVSVVPFVFAMSQPDLAQPAGGRGGPSDLERLVGAIVDAHAECRRPRRPWQPELRLDLEWRQLNHAHEPLAATVGVVDQPSRQAQSPWSWAPHDDGNLLLLGGAGRGPTQALLGVALGLAHGSDPDAVHLYGIDYGTGELAMIEALPHVGAIASGDDVERQRRILRRLVHEIEARKAGRSGPTIALLIDGIAGFKAQFDGPELVAHRDALMDIAAAGGPHGVFVVITADQNRSVPSALAGSLPRRLVFALADRLEYGMVGVTNPPGGLPRRRAIDPITQEHVQVALVTGDDVAHVAKQASLTTRTPDPVQVLPSIVRVADIVDAGEVTSEAVSLPLALDDETLTAATITLFGGDHLVIAGPARSGRSSVLSAVAEIIRKICPDDRIAAVCPRPSPLQLSPAVDAAVRGIDDVDHIGGPDRLWLLVDDAEEVDGTDLLTPLIERREEHLSIIAGGRTDALRAHHRHWTRAARNGRRGLILRPAEAADGDLLGARLARQQHQMGPGRGYLVDAGVARLVQAVST